jgi:hypothetical protein
MPEQWAITAAYEPKVDFESNGPWTHSVGLQLAKKLEELPLSFSLSVKKPFDDDKEFQVNLYLLTISRRSSHHGHTLM